MKVYINQVKNLNIIAPLPAVFLNFSITCMNIRLKRINESK